MKKTALILLLFASSALFAQQKRDTISGTPNQILFYSGGPLIITFGKGMYEVVCTMKQTTETKRDSIATVLQQYPNKPVTLVGTKSYNRYKDCEILETK